MTQTTSPPSRWPTATTTSESTTYTRAPQRWRQSCGPDSTSFIENTRPTNSLIPSSVEAQRELRLETPIRRRAPQMKQEVLEITRQGAIQAVGSWRARGCEYVSIIDGVPRPWAPKSFKLIFADAEQRGVELLSLA